VVSRLGDRRRNIITNSGRQCGTHCQAFLDELAAALVVGLDADHPVGLLVIKEVAGIYALCSQMVGRKTSVSDTSGRGLEPSRGRYVDFRKHDLRQALGPGIL